MNVYQMYVAFDNRVGFWVQRDSWGNTCALVKQIGSQTEGELPGKPPYHGNPKVTVDVFDIHNGSLKESDTILSCPGTYAYTQIPDPEWSIKRS
jgi:hypothetical protein